MTTNPAMTEDARATFIAFLADGGCASCFSYWEYDIDPTQLRQWQDEAEAAKE